MACPPGLETMVGQVVMIIKDPLCNLYGYWKDSEQNVDKVIGMVSTLRSRKKDIQDSVREAESKGKEITEEAKDWLEQANKFLKSKKLDKLTKLLDSSGISRNSVIERIGGTAVPPLNLSLQDSDEDRRKKNDQSCSTDVCHRLKRGRIATKLFEEGTQLIGKAPQGRVTKRQSISKVKGTFRNRIEEYKSLGLKSRKKIQEDILKKLEDDNVHVVGLCGPEYVGKTKMARDIVNDDRVKSIFGGSIPIIDVSPTPNMKDIQYKMVEAICAEWKDLDNVRLRAFILSMYLSMYTDKKILIILDNVWGKINLNKLGIFASKNCKILVVSRMRDVCEAMDVEEDDVVEIGQLNLEEARYLFWTHVFENDTDDQILNQVTSLELLHLTDDMLMDKCRGLPLAVITLAKVLRDQNLSQWKKFVDELDTKNRQVIHAIWEKYMKHLDNTPEKKMFFFTSCLFPLESPIPVQELMRYAMGLELIQCVNNLTEAMTLANTWARQLISSSLFEYHDKSSSKSGQLLHVVLPKLVRDQALFLMATEKKHNFMVEPIPRWHTKETCQTYTAISMMPDCDHSRLKELESEKLQMLILDKSKPVDEIRATFFKGMTYLKVLVLKNLELHHLSEPIQGLKFLRLLSLETCELGDVKWISKLTSLVVLSFREFSMEELPAEAISNKRDLRLLDLSNCNITKGVIPANVLGTLSQLEGLYADGFANWANDNQETDTTRSDDGNKASVDTCAAARINELNNLRYLNVLKLYARRLQQFPTKDDQFVKNLDQFYISVGDIGSSWKVDSLFKELCRILQLRSMDISSLIDHGWLTALLRKSEMIRLGKINKLQQFIDDGENPFRFTYLQALEISSCSEMQFFSSTPFKAPSLDDLRVLSCGNLKFFFGDKGSADDFLNLRKMKLLHLKVLVSVVGEISFSTTSDDVPQVQGHPAFFNRKIKFPSLEELEMHNCGEIVNLWDFRCKDNDYVGSFNNLVKLSIMSCDKLEVLASFTIAAALKKLKDLTIYDCPLLREVVVKEDEDDMKIDENLFPSLDTITLGECPKLQMFLSVNQYQQILELPSLHTLNIKDCPKMQSFSCGTCNATCNAPALAKVTVDDQEHPIQENIADRNINYLLPKPKQSEGSVKEN